MFGPDLQKRAREFAERLVRPLASLGLTPNMATFLGFLFSCVTAVVLATGNLRIGAVMVLLSGAFDMVDGALARVRNQKTTFGAFFDSTLDRYSEAVVLLGLIVFALTAPALPQRNWIVALAYVAGIGSLMVSYTRARAEGLGLDAKSGLLARPERVILLAAGLLIGGQDWLLWTLLALAAASVLTSIQRIVAVRRVALRADESASSAEAAPSSASRNGAWRPEGGWSLPFFSSGRHRRTPGDSSGSSVTSGRATRR
ncbi:MAG TPA: CDP-alcohol phosphatidyltransferase family protein [Ktedonobacterales bacterium]|jgi:CDP-diacylglycerol--glycerol-3-phosphate 3-phosphatidyltransferase